MWCVSGVDCGESDGGDCDESGDDDSDASGGSGSDSGSDSDSGDESKGSSTGVQEEDDGSAWSVSDVECDGDDGDDSDDQVVRPTRHLRNVVGSDEDGEATVRATHPPGTMAVFDELAPADINNPCEFQFKAL